MPRKLLMRRRLYQERLSFEIPFWLMLRTWFQSFDHFLPDLNQEFSLSLKESSVFISSKMKPDQSHPSLKDLHQSPQHRTKQYVSWLETQYSSSSKRRKED
eukprot:Protomagalhaensia_wolfi_Nauph_80__4487@NODE_45_length_4272_cov_191_556107_g36_i0_p7_GENE_NODE_45_length_4272_cov_191_556107_g36_i0NODE_45_length_4272_cov_191_556107_g36_i0_p7_ORF_typecomplete_len101_score12_53DNA_pack_C/PF02499_15/19DNA_pack_C/PF02499_15/0_26_NODE_45_length_4272_cov_191_556107_g36_i025472849